MKDLVRKEMLQIRKNIIDKEKKSTIIVDKIINLDIYKKSHVIALYNSMTSEVDTSLLIENALQNKVVLLPRIINNEMKFIVINKNTKYENNKLGFKEPIGKIYNDKIDLIIIPGIAFDRNLNRLGFGKGYYDKYLFNKDIYKVGICFDEQVLVSLPVDSHDIKMNLVITEKEFY